METSFHDSVLEELQGRRLVRSRNEQAAQITKGDLAVPLRDSLVLAWRRFFAPPMLCTACAV